MTERDDDLTPSDSNGSDRLALRARFFTAWANLVTGRPVVVLVVCLLLAAASVAGTLRFLEFRSDRSELVDPSLPFQQRYKEFRERFPRWDDAAVVIDLASASSPEAGEAFVAALEARLRADTERFAAVTAGFTADETPPGLILTEPLDRVKAQVAQMKRATVVINAPNLDNLLRLSLLGGALGGPGLDPEQAASMRGLLERALAASRGERADLLGIDSGVRRLVRPGGSLATVLVSLRHKETDEQKIASIAALRGHIGALKKQGEFAGVEAGVTGVPVIEADETAQSMRDGERAGLLSLAGIVLLMLIAYRGVVVPVMATLSLLIGVAWAFAWATLAVGHLQLLSVTFAAMLMGLGIDVAIHLVARLELAHPSHDDLRSAVAAVFRGVGPGIVTASVTVAAGAGAMALTPFDGVAEMGIIAAGGILLCTAAIMCALPAMLMLLKDPARRLRAHDGGESRAFLGSFGRLLYVKPWMVIVPAAALTVIAAAAATRVGYDTDLQNLMPSGTESVAWQRRLERDDERSVWHAVVLARDAEEARAVTLRLRSLLEVGDVGGAGMLFQSDEDLKAKQEVLQALPDEYFYRDAMRETPEPSVQALRGVCASVVKTFEKTDAGLASAARALSEQSDEVLLAALNTYANDRGKLSTLLLALRGAAPVPPERLPAALRETMVAPDGSLLLRVYPKASDGGGSVLAPQRLGPFASAVLAAAPNATGPSIQIHESTKLITGAYRDAALYALAAIVLILLIDFRNLGDTLCALLPVGVGAVLMLAVMALLGMALNLANLIVMPLIVGIGVGCGVHAVRRWRLQPNDPPPGLAGGSGRAITLTTLTTVLGFAALIPGEHLGIKSLGIVMSLGLVMVWGVTVVVLPGVLVVRGRQSIPGNP
ncbi:MAG: MMPL family transporter [Phycisphaerales bacterium]